MVEPKSSLRVRRQLPEMRRYSKRMFGSQYRVEVAETIRTLEGEWTTLDLSKKLPGQEELPWSCVTKELSSLLDLELIDRIEDKTVEGRIPYSRSHQCQEFWALIEEIVTRFSKSKKLHRFPIKDVGSSPA